MAGFTKKSLLKIVKLTLKGALEISITCCLNKTKHKVTIDLTWICIQKIFYYFLH